MPAAARKTDPGKESHGPTWSAHDITSGSSNVKINSLDAAKVGDSVADHTEPSPSTHSGVTISAGSSTVNINGQPAARVGDAFSCGGEVKTGSGNVNIGG